jgi:murein DD-endopeptidase MepM/ murein hydrolase activator NlpD
MELILDAASKTLAAADPAAGRTQEQLKALAAQFEALLVGQMLRDMRQAMFEDEDSGSSGAGAGPLADAMFSELSLALSRAGGLGLGASLFGPLTAEAGVAVDASSSNASLDETINAAPAAFFAPTPLATAPMPGRLSAGFGWRTDPIDGQRRFHNGLDLALPVGQDVPTARAGAVAFAGELPGYGLTVVVKHDDRVSTRYAHLSEILVAPGEVVDAGQSIARSGASGRTTGPHLHFEVLEGGQPVDPARPW